jgi:hypothetical protein
MRLRVVIILALIVAVVGLVSVQRRFRSPIEVSVAPITNASPARTSAFNKSANVASVEVTEPAPAATTSNLFQRINSGELDLHLTPEQIAEYLRRHGTNVETLLAVQSRDYLKLAAELFPNDPRVQYAVLTRDIFPEARREWLENFKRSAPDNPVANYLSAREYLRAGDRERGLQELTDSATKTRYNDYTLEQWQNSEEAQLSAGRSLAEAKFAAGNGLLLPQLSLFKNLAQEMQTVQKDYLATGDAASAERLAQIGHNLALQLSQGEGSRTLINQLVGAAIDRIMLNSLPADSRPEFLERPIQQRIDELTDFRKNVRTFMPEFDAMLARGDENEIIHYYDRIKLQGEYKALEWLHRRNAFR